MRGSSCRRPSRRRRAARPALEPLESRCLPSLVDYVNPFIGTAPTGNNYGFGYDTGDVYPGADRPFGMLQWGPDTTSNIPGGYWYPDNTIKGFSLDHFSGRGCTYVEDVPLMPVPGAVTQSPRANPAAFRSTFSHANESASPGYYAVTLNSGVTVELTTTLRTGIGQLTFNTGSNTNSVLVNIGGSVNGVSDGAVSVSGSEVSGWAQTTIGCGSGQYKVYFTAQFDRPFAASGTWTGNTLHPGTASATGGQAGAYVTFDTTTNPVVRVRTAISFVSVANARLNLQAENPGWDLAAVRQAARTDWEGRLGLIQVDGPSQADKQVFYTALYHTMFHPNVFDDVNGQYLGFDNAVHTVATGHHQYANIPGWDQYRSESQLLALLVPDVTSDIVRSYLNDAAQGGPGLPRWEQMNHNSDGMVGDGPLPYIANAYAFGARDFDTAAALTAMLANAGTPGTTSDGQTVRTNLSEYLARGYIGQDHLGDSASYTLEYETADFALSRFAQALGDATTAQTYLSHALFWRNLFNASTGYITPRNSNGTFLTTSPASSTGFTEGTQAQYTWMVPFDLRGLLGAMGGNAAAVSRLDTFFTQLNGGPNSRYAYMGNEPSEETAWTYDFAGAPWRAQDVVRRIQTQLFTTQTNGLPGNDDAGALSSWYVFSALGLYPDLPGVGGFVLGSPLFQTITLNLPGGHTVQINAPNAADANPYVQSMTLNGVANTHLWLTADTFLTNPTTTLSFDLGSAPNTNWGSAPADAPPSFDSAGAPVAPLHLAATAGNGLATLSWAASPGATSYNVYRGTTPNGEGAIPLVAGLTATAFTDTGLTNGTAYYYLVTAVNADGESGASNEGAAVPLASGAFRVSINFSNNTVEVPTGYVNDVGLAFGDRGNGFRFGWNQDTTADARDRNNPAAPDERYDSFIHMQKPDNPNASWQIALPNGAYAVHLVAGDIDNNFDAAYAIAVQGALAVSGTPTSANKFFEGTLSVLVTGGLLTVSNAPGSMNNKIDYIDISQVSEDGVNLADGFAGAAGLQLNGGAALSGTRLRLTDGGTNEARSAFTGAPVNVQVFTTDFRFQLTNPNADGLTFTLQGVGPTALGAPGGALGYQGVARSVAVKFDLYDNAGEGPDSTGLYVNGASPTVPAIDLRGSGIDLHSGHVFFVHLAYDGTTLTETITDALTGAAATEAYALDIPAAIGGPTAFVGFTAGTGTLTSTQDVLDWAYTPGSASAALQVDLSAQFNRVGIVNDGTTFTGGLDGQGNAYSANLLGSSLSAGGQTFSLGAPGTNNVVKAAGQTIVLPAGSYGALTFLGAAVNGNQPNQTFTVTYADGTTDTFTQSFSDWHTPQGYAGEATAATLGYRNRSNGSTQNGPYYLYLYRFALDSSKTVVSITLPDNANLEILAIDLSS
jgi:predicted alpha-1,2-mannosidase